MRKSELKILGLLLADPSLRLNPNEAAGKAGLSYGAAYQVLAEMAARGILSRKRVGNANVYCLEFGSEPAREALMRAAAERREETYGRYGVGDTIRRTVERVREELPGLYAAVLFGSMAKGEAKKGSDIDLLFILPSEEGLKRDGKLISDICSTKGLESGRTVNSITASLLEFDRMLRSEERNLAKEAVRGGIPVSGAENYFALVLRWLKWKESPI